MDTSHSRKRGLHDAFAVSLVEPPARKKLILGVPSITRRQVTVAAPVPAVASTCVKRRSVVAIPPARRDGEQDSAPAIVPPARAVCLRAPLAPAQTSPPAKPLCGRKPRRTRHNGAVRQPVDVSCLRNPKQRAMFRIVENAFDLDKRGYFHGLEKSRKYKREIAHPIALCVIRDKVVANEYHALQPDFLADFLLLVRNAMCFYAPDKPQVKFAGALKKWIYTQLSLAEKDAPLAKGEAPQQPPSAPPSAKHVEEQHNEPPIKRGRASRAVPDGLAQVERMGKSSRLKLAESTGYEAIADYVFACDEEVVRRKLRTRKRGGCDGKHCASLPELGPYSVTDEKWLSKCNDRARMTECSDACKCTPESCKNRAIGNRQRKKLGVHVREQEVFGIDSYTRNNLVHILPDELEQLTDCEDAKLAFVEHTILPAINGYQHMVGMHPEFASKRPLDGDDVLSHAPFYMSDVLRTIVYKAEQEQDVVTQQSACFALFMLLHLGKELATTGVFSFSAVKAQIKFEEAMCDSAQFVHNYVEAHVLETGEGAICDTEFPVYSKGTGVVCIAPGGIKQNEFVVEFLGEVYPPWCWYEKSDRIRWLENKGAQKQPDFFNMMLERHEDDPDGYDLVFIDPSKKGNYASRLSHSCLPNCIAVSMAVCGKFRIGVFAIKDIHCGEELSFDYNSVTENEQEWKHAVCLCGTRDCRAYYLYYAGTGSFAEVLRSKHGFLQRTANLYLACRTPQLSEGDRKRLVRHNIRDLALASVPEWMRKYASHVLRYVELEQLLLPKELVAKNAELKEEEALQDALGVRRNRLQNLVITLNKMQFVQREGNEDSMRVPPLKPLSAAEAVEKLWYHPESIVQVFLKVAAPHLGEGHRLLEHIRQLTPTRDEKGVGDVRKHLQEIGDALRKEKPTKSAYHHAAADLFHFYANTRFWFTVVLYKSFKSRKFSFRELGYTAAGCATPKKYAAQYVWGQLNFWDRQTIESPDSSLSQMRRGTCSLPGVDSCYATRPRRSASTRSGTEPERGIRRKYSRKVREDLLDWIGSSTNPWPTKWHWGFRNGKCYGSPWLDMFIDKSEEGKFRSMMRDLRTWIPQFVDDEDNWLAAEGTTTPLPCPTIVDQAAAYTSLQSVLP